MGILDKLKPQPRWKHADPSVRFEALRELDDVGELAVLAESDPDPKIRRAAASRVSALDVLGRIAASDPDEETRERASERLLGFACRPSDDQTGLAAVALVSDPKRLSTVAKGEAPEVVRAAALARLDDARALSSIARQAKHETTAAAALARLTDVSDLVEVALHTEHRDVALAAFDRLAPHADLTLLRSIEARAQQKPLSRRVRTVIQDIEREEAARLAALEERRRREAMLCEAMEQVTNVADLAVARVELDRIGASWRALDVTDATALDRFNRAVEHAESSLTRRQREADQAADLQRMRAEAIATRDALCARVETLDGDDVIEQLVPIEEEWRSLLPLVGNGPEADRLAERFAQAVAACRKRHEMGSQLAETRVALDALAAEAEGLLSQDDHGAALARWQSLSREARGLTALLTAALRPAEDLTARLELVDRAFAEREVARQTAIDAEASKARQDAVTVLRRLIERARRVAEADAITLREGDRLMRDIKTAVETTSALSSAREVDEAVTELRALQETVAPRVRELREMDEWRRFANAQRQEQLIAMADAIVSSLKADEEANRPSDLAATAKALRELHTQWHDVAEAPRQTAQRLWDKFRTSTDFIRSRCEVFFAQIRQEREQALQKRAGIVTEAEALAMSHDWGKAAARFQELQTAWNEIGGTGRDAGRDLGQRFRTACNAFFARRREDLADRKKEWNDNLAAKETLCVRAEVLAESTEWDAASAEMKKLQAEWKTVGPVRRSKSEAIWGRFRAAADRFFERYHHRHEIMLASKLAEREASVVELETLVAGEAGPDFAERVRQMRTMWNRSVPIPTPEMRTLTERWRVAMNRAVEVQPAAFQGTDLDPAAVIDRMQKLVNRVESLLGDTEQSQPSASLSQAELLAAKLRSALASNAMGGRANDDAKWRAAGDAVRDAQASWQRLGPTSGPDVQSLEERFREACRRVNDEVRRHAPARAHHGNGQHEQQRQPHRRADRPHERQQRTERQARPEHQPRPERQTAVVG